MVVYLRLILPGSANAEKRFPITVMGTKRQRNTPHAVELLNCEPEYEPSVVFCQSHPAFVSAALPPQTSRCAATELVRQAAHGRDPLQVSG